MATGQGASMRHSLNGSLDNIVGNIAEGWVQDKTEPDDIQSVELFIDGEFIDQTLSDLYRQDLAEAGIGDGCHAFRIPIPVPFYDDSLHVVDIRVKGQSIPASPRPMLLKAVSLDAAGNEERNKEPVSEAEEDLPASNVIAAVLPVIESTSTADTETPEPAVEDVEEPPARSEEEETADDPVAAEFDRGFYLAAYADVAQAGLDPFLHFMESGWREGRDPSAKFSTEYYLQANPDVVEANLNPFWHFIIAGRAEGRAPMPPEGDVKEHETRDAAAPQGLQGTEFDAAYYLQENPDVAQAGCDPEWHYFECGEREGRAPNAIFDAKFYARVNPDVADAGISLFEHYRNAGCHKSDKHILFMGHDAIPAGAQRVLLNIVKWFSLHSDYKVTVLLCDHGQMIPEYIAYADDVYVINNYKFTLDGPLAELLETKWSMIYCNTVRTGEIVRNLLKAMPHTPPVVAHLHELHAVLATFPDDFAALREVSNHFIVVNDSIAEHLSEDFAVDSNAITVAHPFITPSVEAADALDQRAEMRAWSRKELSIPDDAFVVVSCGTAYERKGIDIFVETGIEYLKKHDDSEMRFVWIGDGEDLQTAKDTVEKAGVHGQFVFAGFRTDAARLLACGDVFYMSSREDPFPLVCMEAAQYGIPVIYFDKGTGIGGFVRGGESDAAGVEVKGFDRKAVAKAIRTLREDETLRKGYGEAGAERVFETYTNTRNILRLYGVLLDQGILRPSVTAIVPNYNHENYLDLRITTILEQTLQSLEVIVLDDCSSDNSHEVIETYLADPRVTFDPNTQNSGSPFKQWMKGIKAARSEVIWIAESDDFADPDFASSLVGSFADPAVTIATGRTVITGGDGTPKPDALDPYWNRAEPHLFEGSWKRDGIEFVRSHFGAICTLVNGSGLLLRRSTLMPVAESAVGYKMCGDWLLYLKLLQRGKIFFSEQACNYFRRHEESAVHKVEGTPQYFKERAAIAEYVTTAFHLRRNEIERILWELQSEWDRFAFKNPKRSLDDFVDAEAMRARAITRRGTIGIYIYGMTFSKGGIERIGSQIANQLYIEGYDVIVYCNFRGYKTPIYPLYEGVKLRDVDLSDGGSDLLLAGALKQDRVDVFIPMLSEALFENAIRGGKIAGAYVIASEHNDPWQIERKWWPHKERQVYFQMVDAIHLLLPSFTDSLIEALHEKVTIIPNGVDMGPDYDEQSTCETKKLICVARYSAQKSLHTLIEAFALLRDDFPDWRLQLVGDGELRPELEALVEEKGVGDHVTMTGHITGVHQEMVDSGIFVLPSAFEGFGIVVVEALRAGLPCVAFKDCNGPNVLIEPGTTGELVAKRSPEALAKALAKLMKSKALRQRYGKAGRNAAEKYNLELIFRQWVEYVDQAMAGR